MNSEIKGTIMNSEIKGTIMKDNLLSRKISSVLVAAVMVWLTLSGAMFAATTDKDFTLDDGVGDSPSVIFTDADGNTLTITKNDAGEAVLINNEGGIDFKPSADNDDYLQMLTTGDSSYLYWLGVLTYTNAPGLRVDPATGKLEYRDEDDSAWTALDSIAGGVAFTYDTTSTPDKVYFADGLAAESADFIFGSDQLDDDTGDTTDDYRMFFDKSKGAFRAGYVTGTEWDAANRGDQSFASGYNTTASGYNSTAMGRYTTAGEYYSTAMGYSTNASGEVSTAMGEYTTAQAYASTVLGRYNVIEGTTDSWVATEPVFVIGNGADAANPANALTVLKNGNMEVQGTLKVGSYTLPNTDGTAAQILSTDGSGALSWSDAGGGSGVFTWDTNSTPDKVYFTDGLDAESADFIFGSDQLDDDTGDTTDDYRMFFDKSKGAFRAGWVEGTEWDAANVGDMSFASGYNTTANGDYSTAMGEETNASGNYSTAMGYGTTASGIYSTTMGKNTTAQAYMSTVLGRYNVIGGTTNLWVATEPVFVIGNGADAANPANALTVLKNGNMEVQGTLKVGAYTLPITDGTSDQVLKTNGTGALSWTTMSGMIADGSLGGTTLRWDGAGWVESTALTNNGNDVSMTGDLNIDGGDLTLSKAGGTASLKVTGSASNVTHWVGDEYDIEYRKTLGSAIIDFRAIPVDTTSGAQYRFGLASGSAGENSIYLYEPDSSTIQTRIASSNLSTYFNAQGGNFGIGTTTPTALLHINPPTTTTSQFRLEASAGINPATPNAGDLWFNGTNLNFNDGTTTTDLLFDSGVFTLDTNSTPDKVYFTDGLTDTESADFIFGSDQLDNNTGVTTDDYRMFFDKSKGAFRAGYVTGTQWDAANVGLRSFATGRQTNASGVTSTAMGENTTASGSVSTVMGWGTTASGGASTAMGLGTTASGDVSTAMGDYTTAQAFVSTVLGRYNVISGNSLNWVATDPLFVIGNGADAANPANALTVLKNGKVGIIEDTPTALLHLGPATTAAAQIRLDATAADPATPNPGDLWFNGTNLNFNDGTTTADLLVSGVFTLDTNSTPDKVYFTDGLTTESADFIFGSDQLDDDGDTAHDKRMFFDKSSGAFRAGWVDGTEWDSADVGPYSFASGKNTTADGPGSTAMGETTTASGAGSTAMGGGTTASGSGSTAMGLFTTASGWDSTTMGFSTTAQAYSSVVLGRYNVISGTTGSWDDADPLFVIGNGADAANPANALTVFKNSDFVVGSDQLDDVAGGTDDDYRMFFDKSKGAFRAGLVEGTEWDSANVGQYSFASGNGTTADGAASTATGSETTASGWLSTAMGYNTTAQARSSVVIGRWNVIEGTTDLWEDADPLFVIGNGASAANPANALTVLKNGDFVVGSDQLDNGTGTADDYRMFFDKSSGSFRAGHVTGTNWNEVNRGSESFATGTDTTASGDYSTAMGRLTTASGLYSTAMGQNTTASGGSSTAMGQGTTASRSVATAMGWNTTASGTGSTSMGFSTTAQANMSMVLGRYNVIEGSIASWVATDPLFVIGNGASAANPSNALTVLKNGNMEVQGTLKVGAYTLPITDGTTDQVLKTNGKGALSWTTVSGTITGGTAANNTLRWDGSGWIESTALTNDGSDITLTGDLAVNGGDITTTAMTANLINATVTTVNIAGASKATAIGAATGTTTIGNDLTAAGDLAINGGDITSTGPLTVTPNSGANLNVALSTTGDFTVNTDELVVDTSTGNVGIGTASPGQLLELSNTAGTASLKITGSAANVEHSVGQEYDINYYRDSGLAIMDFRAVPLDTTSGAQYRFGIGSGSTGANVIYLWDHNGGGAQTRIASSNLSTYFNAQGGNFGIGTTTPTALLHINPPTITTSQFRLEASAGINPTTPNAGDLWFNGTNLNFNDGTTTTDLLAEFSFAYDKNTSPDTIFFTDGLTTESADFIFGSDQLNDDSDTTHDYRMFFDKSKGAFRAGRVSGTQWNAANVGDQSFASGYDTKASGTGSTAMGIGTTASGYYSTAMGVGTTAKAYASVVVGQNNVVSGMTNGWVDTDPLFVIGNGGFGTTSNALTVLKNGNMEVQGTLTVGAYTLPNTDGTADQILKTNGSGALSWVAGAGFTHITTTSPDKVYFSDAETGQSADFIFGSQSLNDGGGTKDDKRMFFDKSSGSFRAGYVTGSQWNNTNLGLQSFAMGIDTTASGDSSTAMGDTTTAIGIASTAMGDTTTASGIASTAMGDTTTASGDSSTAMGMGTEASGDYSTAMGMDTEASGNYSTAMGGLTTASGDVSTAMGNNTTAQAYGSTVLGRYNVIEGTTNSWVATEPLFVIGNGTGVSNTANALTVLKNGNVGIGTATFDGTATGVLTIAHGTAPAAGTAGQCYMYAKEVALSSEMHVLDEAGNETQISPHDPVTGEWIFYSRNVKTGRVVRVDMEKLVKAVEKLTGEQFMVETLEEGK